MKLSAASFLTVAMLVTAHPGFAAPDTGAVQPIHRVDPEFPRWAVRSGASHGLVTARLTLDGDGKVSQVDIVNAEPKGVFDSAVIEALYQWRYADGRAGRKIDVEIAFRR